MKQVTGMSVVVMTVLDYSSAELSDLLTSYRIEASRDRLASLVISDRG